MSTRCTQKSLGFHPHFRRKVESDFAGDTITVQEGGFLLREAVRKIRVLKRLADSLEDRRDRERVEHCLNSMIAQRVHGLALG